MSCVAPPQPPRAPAAALAPGFRFHPTDEELVRYYLRRKVAGRPFRVDAISEVDLYRSEPWDLPGKSRIQSRDMEWYFFSALDKKYANRSRTNRATGSGYWKTTGKDRAVCRGGLTVGMKKTLVFHVGRAPKGERTNWVMHEYRLEDEELARAGVPQDAFVVCRIFQKKGPGPQNGAQYGAPFMEDEWEEDETPILKVEEGEGTLNVLSDPRVTEKDDYEQIQGEGVQDGNTTLLVEPGELDGFNDFIDPENLLQTSEDLVLSNATDGNIELTGQYCDQNIEGLDGDSDAADQNQCLAIQNDEFLELNDFAHPVDTNSQDGVVCPEGTHDGTIFVNGEVSSQLGLHQMKDVLNTDNENVDLSQLLLLSETLENYVVESEDLLESEPSRYSLGEPDEDGMPYFDASSHYLDTDHGFSVDMNDFMDPAIPSSSVPDLVDEWITFFDATENMQSSDFDLKAGTYISNLSNLGSVVDGYDVQVSATSSRPLDIDGGNSSSSSATPNANKGSSLKNLAIHGERDGQADNSWDKAFSRRLVSMLGAISSPPAFAAEYPTKGGKSIEHYSAAQSSNSIQVTAGMIQIHGMTIGKDVSLLKNGDVRFLLSYGMTNNDETSKLAVFSTLPKMPGGIMAFVLRNSFHLLFLSVLFLAASVKIWVCAHEM